MHKRGKDMDKFKAITKLLMNKESLPQKHRDHILIGNYILHRECHIESDWLLIYRVNDDTLFLERTGTHSDLF